MGSLVCSSLARRHLTIRTKRPWTFCPRRSFERNLTSYGYPEVYHNSFWSNYYTNYWQPASSYYNSFSLPPYYPLPRYQFDELPGDDFSVSHPTCPISKTRKNVRERSQHYLSKMIAKRFPFVNGNIVIFN